jgi:hypothetical protein
MCQLVFLRDEMGTRTHQRSQLRGAAAVSNVQATPSGPHGALLALLLLIHCEVGAAGRRSAETVRGNGAIRKSVLVNWQALATAIVARRARRGRGGRMGEGRVKSEAGTYACCSSSLREAWELAGNTLTLCGHGAQRKAMFSEIDAEERDALREIGRGGGCSGDGRPGAGGIRIAGAGAGVQQVKECSFPGGSGYGARAAKGGERECSEGGSDRGLGA